MRSASSGATVTARGVEYVALASRWNGSWQVFVLDPEVGFLGMVNAATLVEVEPAARDFLSDHFVRPAGDFQVVVIRS
jgi:hypothetical protein